MVKGLPDDFSGSVSSGIKPEFPRRKTIIKTLDNLSSVWRGYFLFLGG